MHINSSARETTAIIYNTDQSSLKQAKALGSTPPLPSHDVIVSAKGSAGLARDKIMALSLFLSLSLSLSRIIRLISRTMNRSMDKSLGKSAPIVRLWCRSAFVFLLLCRWCGGELARVIYCAQCVMLGFIESVRKLDNGFYRRNWKLLVC